jgi:hypothetical protein
MSEERKALHTIRVDLSQRLTPAGMLQLTYNYNDRRLEQMERERC